MTRCLGKGKQTWNGRRNRSERMKFRKTLGQGGEKKTRLFLDSRSLFPVLLPSTTGSTQNSRDLKRFIVVGFLAKFRVSSSRNKNFSRNAFFLAVYTSPSWWKAKKYGLTTRWQSLYYAFLYFVRAQFVKKEKESSELLEERIRGSLEDGRKPWPSSKVDEEIELSTTQRGKGPSKNRLMRSHVNQGRPPLRRLRVSWNIEIL